jgi:hypothetical protein
MCPASRRHRPVIHDLLQHTGLDHQMIGFDELCQFLLLLERFVKSHLLDPRAFQCSNGVL